VGQGREGRRHQARLIGVHALAAGGARRLACWPVASLRSRAAGPVSGPRGNDAPSAASSPSPEAPHSGSTPHGRPAFRLADVSHWPTAKIDGLRALLRGQPAAASAPARQRASLRAVFRGRGFARAQPGAGNRRDRATLGTDRLARRQVPWRTRGVVARMAARIVGRTPSRPPSAGWHTTTLTAGFGVAEANDDHLNAAMDWLLARQGRIQQWLGPCCVRRNGAPRPVVELLRGQHLPLAWLCYSRDGRRGMLQVSMACSPMPAVAR